MLMLVVAWVSRRMRGIFLPNVNVFAAQLADATPTGLRFLFRDPAVLSSKPLVGRCSIAKWLARWRRGGGGGDRCCCCCCYCYLLYTGTPHTA